VDTSIALHEAGHALAAHVRGVEVFEVAIDADGHAMMTHDTPDTLLRAGHDPASVGIIFGIIACAGAAAAGDDLSASDKRGVEQGHWLCGFSDVDYYAFRDGCMGLAQKLVEQHRDKIERVAAVLVERGRLHGDEFRALLAEDVR
jgi:hypothetical protein